MQGMLLAKALLAKALLMGHVCSAVQLAGERRHVLLGNRHVPEPLGEMQMSGAGYPLRQ
jgi:hypothetical protein